MPMMTMEWVVMRNIKMNAEEVSQVLSMCAVYVCQVVNIEIKSRD